MPVRIFLIGATGYIGGTLLKSLLLSDLYPEVSVLVRTEKHANEVKRVHPSTTSIIGDLSSHDLLVAAASSADIVIFAARNTIDGIHSLLQGLSQGVRGGKRGVFAFVSAPISLCDNGNFKPGEVDFKVYSDIDDYDEIMSLPLSRWHAARERMITCTGIERGVDTLILCPGLCLGTGQGVGAKTSMVHYYASKVLERGKAFTINGSHNVWTWSTVQDTTDAILFVIRKAWIGSEPKIEFGERGYYFIGTGEMVFGNVASRVAKELERLGGIETSKLETLTLAEALGIFPLEPAFWTLFSSNCRAKMDRLSKLGWAPKEVDWDVMMATTTEYSWKLYKEGKSSKLVLEKVEL